jgi:hypothetical protein
MGGYRTTIYVYFFDSGAKAALRLLLQMTQNGHLMSHNRCFGSGGKFAVELLLLCCASAFGMIVARYPASRSDQFMDE